MIHDCVRDFVNLPCGCLLTRCTKCGVKFSSEKCILHKPVKHDSRMYYLHELRGLVQDIPQHTKVASEFILALRKMGVEIPEYKRDARVLDIGAGLGFNASTFLNRGYRYEALEIDEWAAEYIFGAYATPVHRCSFEDFPENAGKYEAIISCHVLEHFKNAKAMLTKMFNFLADSGRIYILVPDGSDLGNPDHLTFFSEESLKCWMEEAGFSDVKVITESIVIWEKFIYATGVKNV